MKCFICSTENPDNSVFCRGCGTRISTESQGSVISPVTGKSLSSTELSSQENNQGRKTRLESETSIRQAGKIDFPGKSAKKTKLEVDGNEATENAAKLSGFLVTFTFSKSGRYFPVREGRNVIGRSFNCDIPIVEEETLSSEHFEIFIRQGIVRVTDLGAQNSTIVNGNDIYRQTVTVSNGAIIKSGKIKFIFVLIPESEEMQ